MNKCFVGSPIWKLIHWQIRKWIKSGLNLATKYGFRCFGLGLQNGNISAKGFIAAQFDDVMITNLFLIKTKNE